MPSDDYKNILIIPNWNDEYKKKEIGNKEALGVQYLVSILKSKEINCDTLNAYAFDISNKDAISKVLDNNYRFVGVSCFSQRSYAVTKEFIKGLRNKGYSGHISLGGCFPSIKFIEIMNDIRELDTIILGEGEIALPILIEDLKHDNEFINVPGVVYRANGKIEFSSPERVRDLNCIPFPIRDIRLLNKDPDTGKKFFRLLSGRGCYGKCSFCSVINFYQPRHRIYRSPQNVTDEIEYLVSTYGINTFRFNDEIFYDSSKQGKEWVASFVKEIKLRKQKINFDIEMRPDDITYEEVSLLKSVGLTRIFIGAESGIQSILNEMNKNISVDTIKKAIKIMNDCGVEPMLGWIAIIPTMSFDELKENYRFLFSTKCFIETNIYNKLNIYSGCEYENILREKGLLLENTDFYERHNYIFADKKVALFSQYIDEIRKYFTGVKINLQKAKSICYKSKKINIYEDLKRYSVSVWVNIINDLLSMIEEKSEYDISTIKNAETHIIKFNEIIKDTLLTLQKAYN